MFIPRRKIHTHKAGSTNRISTRTCISGDGRLSFGQEEDLALSLSHCLSSWETVAKQESKSHTNTQCLLGICVCLCCCVRVSAEQNSCWLGEYLGRQKQTRPQSHLFRGPKKKAHPLAPTNSTRPNNGGLRSPEEHNSYLRNLHLNTYHIFVCLSGRSSEQATGRKV